MTKYSLLLVSLFFCRVAVAIPPVPEAPAFPVMPSGNVTYHVDNESGDDAANNGSVSRPWKTLGFAADKLSAGDTLIIHGTRTPYILNNTAIFKSGTERRWISIKGEDGAKGERVTLAGRLSLGGKHAPGVSYVYLDNLYFRGPGQHGLNLIIYGGSHHLVFDNIEIDCQGSPENSRGEWTENDVHHIWFRDVYVHRCGYKRNPPTHPPPPDWKPPTDCGGICVKGDNIRDVVFLRVKVTDNVGDGIGGGSKRAYGSSYYKNCISERNTGDGFDPGSALTVIVNCISRNNGGHQGAGYKFWSRESWLVNSVAYNNKSVGVMVRPRHDGESKAYILNSTFALNSVGKYGGQICTSPNDPANGRLEFYIYNNIFYALNTSAIVINNNKSQIIAGEGHNYYFSARDESRKRHWTSNDAVHIRDGHKLPVAGYSFPEMADHGRWMSDTGHGAGDIGEIAGPAKPDPGFRDLAGGDLRLAAGSRAIGGGLDLGIMSDITGKAVPSGEAPDMGAY